MGRLHFIACSNACDDDCSWRDGTYSTGDEHARAAVVAGHVTHIDSVRHSFSDATPPPESFPRCNEDELRATITGGEGATGHAADYVVIFNPSPTACSIGGPPSLEPTDGEGAILARSQGRQPFMGLPVSTPHLIPADALSTADDWGGASRARRAALTVIAQGDCPGGVFPPGSQLRLVLPRTGAVQAEAFKGTLPFDYRCYGPQGPPAGIPELLIGDLLGTGDLG